MPLTPPPDFTKPLLAIAIGLGLALLAHFFTRSTLPHVGDNIHHLPHGGLYRDGTKSITYHRPNSSQRDAKLVAACLVLGISFLLFLTRPRVPRPCQCPLCLARA